MQAQRISKHSFVYSDSRALPDDDGQVAAKEHVQQVLDLVRDLKPKPLTDHHVPGGNNETRPTSHCQATLVIISISIIG